MWMFHVYECGKALRALDATEIIKRKKSRVRGPRAIL